MQCTCHIVHFTRGYIWSQNVMYMSSCVLHMGGGYIWSQNVMCMSSCALHIGGISNLRMQYTCHLVHFRSSGVSDLRMHFIWKVYYLYYELLNTAQCRLLYVVVIVITVAYSDCCFWCFWCFLCVILHG